jgi:hypothetical protein
MSSFFAAKREAYQSYLLREEAAARRVHEISTQSLKASHYHRINSFSLLK